jgi:hypothetical protein
MIRGYFILKDDVTVILLLGVGFFRKFAEIFASQAALPVSTTLVANFAAGVIDTGGKFANSVVDTGGAP